MQHFTDMLGVQHLDVPHLRGRTGSNGTVTGKGKEIANCISKGRTDKRGDKKKKGAESTKEVDTFEQVGASGNDDRAKKDRVDRKKKAKIRTWSDVVKGMMLGSAAFLCGSKSVTLLENVRQGATRK